MLAYLSLYGFLYGRKGASTVIELKNVSSGYGKRRVIANVNLIFPKGEITSIIGANGCGKSTLLML
ncbi:MAG: ATP-binding cassette domain-containing protein, partial [Oscillospiraceae bacterium]|nr:ATP-binding cassette domain-containing protein [Oscillospiraceae bacterium]